MSSPRPLPPSLGGTGIAIAFEAVGILAFLPAPWGLEGVSLQGAAPQWVVAAPGELVAGQSGRGSRWEEDDLGKRDGGQGIELLAS